MTTTSRPLGAVFLLLFLGANPVWSAGQTRMLSTAQDGTQANANSGYPGISADGRYAVFGSEASNLVADDTNSVSDIFVVDTVTKQIQRVSVASDGSQSNGASVHPWISADGRFVAFYSDASNLVAGDNNSVGDVFVRDLLSGTTTRVSVASDGGEANGYSNYPSISADGRFVSFESWAGNLVAGDSNGADVFVHDRRTGVTERVSVASDGAQSNGESWQAAISSNGRYVAFESMANNLTLDSACNATWGVFVHDRQTHATAYVSMAADGGCANGDSYYPLLSSSGRYIAFHSSAGNLVAGDNNGLDDVFVRDIVQGTTERATIGVKDGEANGGSRWATISDDGRYVGFESDASNLIVDDVNGITDAFVYDRNTGQTERVSVASDGSPSDGASNWPILSADGRHVVFSSSANNLALPDINGGQDVFLRDRWLRPASKAEIALTVSVSPGTPTKGQPYTYTFTMKNNGPATATGLSLVNVFADGLTLGAMTPSQGKCARAQVGVCRLGSLAAGATATVTAQVTPKRVGVFRDTAAASAYQKDITPGNNRVEHQVTVK